MAARQNVSLRSLVENVGGASNRPTFATNALDPSAGSVVQSPPFTARLLAVDYVTTTGTFTVATGTAGVVTFQPAGFTGLLSNQQRYVSGRSTPGTVQTIANNTNPLTVGESTQLLLQCSVQTYSIPANTAFMGASLATQAIENQLSAALIGPWFPGGTKYLAFSVLPVATIFNFSGATITGGQVTIGISASLYSMYVQ